MNTLTVVLLWIIVIAILGYLNYIMLRWIGWVIDEQKGEGELYESDEEEEW